MCIRDSAKYYVAERDKWEKVIKDTGMDKN